MTAYLHIILLVGQPRHGCVANLLMFTSFWDGTQYRTRFGLAVTSRVLDAFVADGNSRTVTQDLATVPDAKHIHRNNHSHREDHLPS